MKTKIFTFFLALVFSKGTMFAVSVQVGDIYYELKSVYQTAEVTYKSKHSTGWYNEGWNISTAIIPSTITYNGKIYTVTKIGDYAFADCDSLTTVIIDNGISSIGWGSFRNCKLLTSISLSSTITSIGNSAFSGCEKLTLLIFPENIKSIGSNAFSACKGLTSINFPENIKSIGSNAFSACKGLTSIIIPENINSVGSNAFSYCTGLTSVTWNVKNHANYQKGENPFPTNVTSFVFGENVEHIPAYLCNGLSFQSVALPDGLKKIGFNAFSDCVNLKSITIPDSVKIVDAEAFKNCSKLESVYVGINVDSIRGGAFEECNQLKAVYISDVEAWCKITFGSSSNPLEFGHNLYLNGKLLTDVVIPATITEIKNWAFCGCRSIKSVKILGDITKIGRGAFQECKKMSKINIPYSTRSIGKSAFSDCGLSNQVIIPEGIDTIEEFAFSWCGETDIIIPNSVTTINSMAFYGAGANLMHKIIIPNGVTYIGRSAFYLGQLDELYIGKNVEHIEGGAFSMSSGPYNVYAQMQIPPEILRSVFNRDSLSKKNCYVSQNSLSLYQNASVWQEFNLIADHERYIATGLPNNPLYGWVEGHAVYLNGDTATFNAHANEGFEFLRWSDGNTDNPRKVIISSDTTLIAEYSVSKYYITVTCDEQQGTISGSNGYFDYGSNHSFEAIPNEGYYFVQWSDSITDNPRIITLTKDTSFTAIFAKQIFTITFVDDNDTIISSQEVEYNTMPVLPVDPLKIGDAQYSYTFAGWSPTIVAATKDATYKATYNRTTNQYTITFLNDDNSVLSSRLWDYGSIPTCEQPIKEEDEKYIYTFNVWTPEVVPVVADATYTATYEATPKSEGMEDVFGDTTEKPSKVFENGNIYILLPNGQKYSILGEQIK